MFARLHTIETTKEQYEAGLEIIQNEFLPWARESSGFCGLIGLADETREKALVLTLWKDRDALEEAPTRAISSAGSARPRRGRRGGRSRASK